MAGLVPAMMQRAQQVQHNPKEQAMAPQADVSLAANLAGVNPFNPLQFDQMPEGAYQVQIESFEVNANGNILWTVRSVDEPAQGESTGIMLGTDFSKKGNVSHLKALVVGAMQAQGQDPSQVETQINVPASSLIGRKAYIYVKHAPEGVLDAQGRRPFPNRNFVTRDFYEAQRKAMASNGAPAAHGQAPAVAAPAAAKPAGLASLFGGAR
jgi:hypothetical protein